MFRGQHIIGLVVVGATLGQACTGLAQCQQETLRVSSRLERGFGGSIAIDGDAALVSQVLYPSGWVYAFRYEAGAWTAEAELSASDGRSGDDFGAAIDLDGDLAIIGEPSDSSLRGAAYVFRYDSLAGWTQEQKLTAWDAQNSEYFGEAVAISGTRVVVGSYYDSVTGGGYDGENAGSAYTYERQIDDSWLMVGPELLSPSPVRHGYFGHALALAGTRLFVGEPGTNTVHVFARGDETWDAQSVLTPSIADDDDMFGLAVACSEDGATVAVGAPYAGADDDGAVFVYELAGDTWSQVARLTHPSADAWYSIHFGSSLGLAGDRLLVGADSDYSDWDSAIVYARSGGEWAIETTLEAITEGASMGKSVALDGDTGIVGGNLSTDPYEGVAFVYDVADCGSMCSGLEAIGKAACKNRNGVNILKVILTGGLAGDSFTVTLTDGSTRSGTINDRGKGKAKFSGRLAGDAGTATAEWGCGATAEKAYACP